MGGYSQRLRYIFYIMQLMRGFCQEVGGFFFLFFLKKMKISRENESWRKYEAVYFPDSRTNRSSRPTFIGWGSD